MKTCLFFASLLFSVNAIAADRVSLGSKVFVERQVLDADGRARTVRDDPKLVVPGEKLVFVLSYKNEGTDAAEKFVVTNPIPNSVAFVGSDVAGADVSVDGGKSWGALVALKIKGADGVLRPAAPSDVTHIRWVFAKPIPAGATGSLIFRGQVR